MVIHNDRVVYPNEKGKSDSSPEEKRRTVPGLSDAIRKDDIPRLQGAGQHDARARTYVVTRKRERVIQITRAHKHDTQTSADMTKFQRSSFV